MDIAVFGNSATVQVLKFHQMPEVGRTATAHNAFADEIYFGGCAFNVFYGLTKLGIRCRPVLTYADPRIRQKLYDICQEYNLPTDAIEGPPNESYSTCLILQDHEKNHITMMYRFGADSDKSPVEQAPHTILPAHFKNINMVLMVMGNPATSYEVVRQAKLHRLPIAFSYRDDPNLLPKALLDVILPETEILFTNEVEAASLCQLYGMDSITEWFKQGRARVIVTTLGKRGCVVYSHESTGAITKQQVPITDCPVTSVDAVGAGDAFVAGFLYGYYSDMPLWICAQYGSTAASFVLAADGSTTNLPTARQLLQRNATRPHVPAALPDGKKDK